MEYIQSALMTQHWVRKQEPRPHLTMEQSFAEWEAEERIRKATEEYDDALLQERQAQEALDKATEDVQQAQEDLANAQADVQFAQTEEVRMEEKLDKAGRTVLDRWERLREAQESSGKAENE